MSNNTPKLDIFLKEIHDTIHNAQANTIRRVDFCRVQMYWNLARGILKEEQQGAQRAEYGKYLIKIWPNSYNQSSEVGFLQGS